MNFIIISVGYPAVISVVIVDTKYRSLSTIFSLIIPQLPITIKLKIIKDKMVIISNNTLNITVI